MLAGLATLKKLTTENFYSNLKEKTERLVIGILSRARAAKIPLTVNFSCGIFGLIFTSEERIIHYAQMANYNAKHFRSFFHKMLDNGVYVGPSAFESGFIFAAHTIKRIKRLIKLWILSKIFLVFQKHI